MATNFIKFLNNLSFKFHTLKCNKVHLFFADGCEGNGSKKFECVIHPYRSGIHKLCIRFNLFSGKKQIYLQAAVCAQLSVSYKSKTLCADIFCGGNNFAYFLSVKFHNQSKVRFNIGS